MSMLSVTSRELAVISDTLLVSIPGSPTPNIPFMPDKTICIGNDERVCVCLSVPFCVGCLSVCVCVCVFLAIPGRTYHSSEIFHALSVSIYPGQCVSQSIPSKSLSPTASPFWFSMEMEGGMGVA